MMTISTGTGPGERRVAPWQWVTIICGMIWVTAFLPMFAECQTTARQVEVSSEITCPTCRIEAARITTLGAEADTLDFGPLLRNASSMIARDREGSFYVAPLSMKNPSVFVFDSSGRLTRQIGRRGQGPGEFTLLWSLALGPMDTLYVVDYSRRMSVFSPDGLFVRSLKLPLAAEQVLPMRDGVFVAMGNRPTPAAVGLPLHLLTSNGISLFAFGDENPIVDPRYGVNNLRQISQASNSTIWASRDIRYEIQRWDREGSLVETIIRHAEWFPPRDPEITEPLREELPARRVTKPSISWFKGSYQDDRGLLWLNSIVADQNWREHDMTIGGGPITPEVLDKLYDTLIEVIDPVEGNLLASIRLPFHNFGFIGENAIARERQLESGLVEIEIWQLRFTY